MGATDSKLQFKSHIFRLFEVADIPADDPYWIKFWEQPSLANDVFTILTASDIRRTRDTHPENLEALILAVSSRLVYLWRNASFPHPERAPANELLNCLRLLTRILPFVYERDDSDWRTWESRFFWSKRRTRQRTPTEGTGPDEFVETRPLAEELIDLGLDLLFCAGFTVPGPSKSPSQSQTDVTGPPNDPRSYAIWETGVGCTTPLAISHDVQSNRVEVLRFLLTLASDCMYKPLSTVAVSGSQYLTYMVTKPDKRLSMAVLCSLLNTTLKYSPGWKVPYDHVLIIDRNRQLVIHSLQFLVVLLVYPVPESESQVTNWYRHYMSKIHRLQDIQFIADAMVKLMSQPIQASASYLPGSQAEIPWVTELTMLFWELCQCNRKFKAYLISSNCAHDFEVLLLIYIHEKHSDLSKESFVRLCAYTLLHLTSDAQFSASLGKRFEGQKNLPANLKLSYFNGSYADYLIIQLTQTINTLSDAMGNLVATLIEIIYNVSPYVSQISYTAASNLVQLFGVLSASCSSTLQTGTAKQVPPALLLLNKLASAMLLMIKHNFRSNRNLLFVMLRNDMKFKSFDDILVKVAGTDSVFIIHDDEKEESESSLSAKAKGKQPTGRNDSQPPAKPDNGLVSTATTLHSVVNPIVQILEHLKASIPYSQYFTSNSTSEQPTDSKLQPHVVIESIGNIASVPGVDLDPASNEPVGFEPIRFSWSSNSLGWYESILWGSIYQNERQMLGTVVNDATSLVVPSRISNVGVWNGTYVKLFRVQQTAAKGPSLLHPKGAVDAVADSMIQQFGKLAGSRNGSSTRNSSDQ